MAQYYQIVGQDQPIQTVTIEELRQYYPNITCLESAAGIQYVVNNQDESTTQFQSQQIQQIVLNTDTSQQIIVDQPQTNYQPQNQPYTVQENEIVPEYPQVNSQQQVYYTTPKTHILPAPQAPILTQQLSNPHIINSTTGIRQMVPQHLLAQRRAAMTPTQNRALPQNLGVRVQFTPLRQQEQIVEPQQRQTQQVSNVQNDNQFVVNESRVMILGQIKQELGQNQQENVQQNLIINQPMKKPCKSKRNYRRPSARGGGGGARGRGCGVPQLPPQQTLSIPSKPVSQYPGKVSSPAVQQFSPRGQAPIPLSPQTPNGQSPAFSVNNPPQQQFVDDSGGGSAPDEYKDSARMLVCLENGEQRLITFTLPKESCTVQDLLEQVGVPFNADTKIECIANPGSEIDYIVNVGAVNNPTFPMDAQQMLTVENLSESQDSAVPQSDSTAPKSPEQVPEPPKELPKFVPGFLAVCNHCGYLSEDFNRCQRCKTKLPDDVKSISSKSDAKQHDEKKNNGKIESPKPQIIKPVLIPVGIHAQGAKPPAKSPRGRKPKAQDLEPVVLTLSSDDEETAPKIPIAGLLNNANRIVDNPVTLSAIQKEPVIPEDCNSDIEHEFEEGIYGGGRDEELKLNTQIHSTTLPCRTIRIGSYRFVPREEISISSLGVKMFVPLLNDQTQTYKLFIPMKYIIKVLGTFSKSLPVLFFYVTPSIASIIRKNIKMDECSDYYFDPLSKEDPFKRITFLPEAICEDTKQKIKDIFLSTTYKMLEELSPKEANDILIRTCPREGGTLKVIAPQILSFSEVRQLLIYPPGKGGIAINTEDYLCLAQDQFLNDVIIDFYLKYLVTDVLAPPMQEKVYIFSSFFYKRLTTKPAKASKRSNPYEVDPNLSPAEKRHCRVKSWTKNVNIFEKDYIIIPINENSHWFLAIICFPGLEGGRSMKDANKIIKVPVKEKKKVSITIGNTTITTMKNPEDKSLVKSVEKPIKCDDEEGSDRDEAEGDESELEESENESENDENSDKKTAQREPIKQPCILIFDSLAGASRSRVVATLRDYLTCEHRTKLNSTKTFTKDNIKGACPKVPQQMNFTDCGLYVLQYVESFFKDPISDYHIPIKLLKNWFEEIVVTRKREEISNLIRELMRENNRDSSILPDISFPTLNGELISNVEARFSEAEEEGELEDEEEEPAKIENSLQQLQTMYNSDSSAESQAKEASSPPISTSGFIVSNIESGSIKPDLSEYAHKSNRETMSYLKSKRIIRHRNHDANEVKKQKVD